MNYTKGIIVVCFLIPIPSTFHILFGQTAIYPSPPTIGIDVKAKWFPISRALLNSIQCSLTAIVTAIFNSSALYLLLLRNKYKNRKTAISKTEIGLLSVCCWDFFINLIYASHQVRLTISWLSSGITLTQLYFYFSDSNVRLCQQRSNSRRNLSSTYPTGSLDPRLKSSVQTHIFLLDV